MRRIGFVLRRFGSRSLQALALGLRAILPENAFRVVRPRAARYRDRAAPHLGRFAYGLGGLPRQVGASAATDSFTVANGPSTARASAQ